MVDFSTLDAEWRSQETAYNEECEKLVAELRDLELQFAVEQQQQQQHHVAAIADLKESHQAAILDLQSQIEEGLAPDDQDSTEDLDNAIAALRQELADLDNVTIAAEDIELVDEDADAKIRVLEDRLEEQQQQHEDALHQRDDDSRAATRMIEELIEKNLQAEESHREQVNELIETLNALDSGYREKVDEIETDMADERKQTIHSIRSDASKISVVQQNITKKQRDYDRTIQELHDQAERLRTALEARTAREKQQMKEAIAYAQEYATEKRKLVSMNREYEILHSELVRETIEHETLMKDLTKMDSYVLAQMSAGGSRAGRSGGSSTLRTSKF
jgi:hypothetical protein